MGTLIIAISFHQFFEGFAVGQIVLDAQFGFWKKFAMISFYSLTTSVGICIGIGTYLGNGGDSGETQGVLITIGVIDAICGGLLHQPRQGPDRVVPLHPAAFGPGAAGA